MMKRMLVDRGKHKLSLVTPEGILFLDRYEQKKYTFRIELKLNR